MIGNNACGSRSLGYGRTVDNIARLRGIYGTGQPFDLRAVAPERGAAVGEQSEESRELRLLVNGELEMVRTTFPRFGRQVSGYALEHLLPERGFDLARLLVGSEGTPGVLTEATVRLVRDPAYRRMVVLGYPDIATAGDAAPAVLTHQPTACEGLDARLVDTLRRRRGSAPLPALPAGASWLFVEISGDDEGEVRARAHAVATDASTGALEARVIDNAEQAATLWRIRADGAGLAGRTPAGRPAYAGWEDAAVPPKQLGRYLREFDSLVAEFGLTASPYGHFGEGCVHARLDLPLDRPDARGVLRSFMLSAAELVARYGGSLSGRSRGTLEASCPRSSTRTTPWTCSPRSRTSVTPTTCSTQVSWSVRRHWTLTFDSLRPPRPAGTAEVRVGGRRRKSQPSISSMR